MRELPSDATTGGSSQTYSPCLCAKEWRRERGKERETERERERERDRSTSNDSTREIYQTR